ncbi:hypothetical protein ACTPDI_18335 [Clostridioides difficile]|uniref:hypothetical protein n=1 Tax=Clostridioides sp. ES-S-0145-01 TaxID=2770784 RepID=UPI001D11DCC8|nr:hypothetical protein [Clostridioides sp. ES-S-0145-01]
MKCVKKVIALGLSIALIIPVISINALEKKDTNVNNQIINVIESNVSYTKEGIEVSSDLKNDLKEINVEDIKEQMIEQGIDSKFINNFNSDVIYSLVKENIDDINEGVKNKTLKITPEEDIINNTDNSFYVQGGSTYTQKFSWGVRQNKSTAAANRWVYDLNKSSQGFVATGAVSILLGGIGAPIGFVSGLSAAYMGGLANKVSYVNSRNNRGITADINWWLTYAVKNQ